LTVTCARDRFRKVGATPGKPAAVLMGAGDGEIVQAMSLSCAGLAVGGGRFRLRPSLAALRWTAGLVRQHGGLRCWLVSYSKEISQLSLTCRDFIFPAALAVLISVLCCLNTSSPSFAEEMRIVDDFVWKKDVSTGSELASSRSDSSFNFFDVGDLSYYSMYLVEQDLGRISAAAGLTIDRNPKKNSSIAIVHDTKVFSRLKNDKPSFHSLGFSDDIIGMLEKRAPDDAKCVTMTVSDDKNNVVTTIVLLSEKFDGCLVRALLDSFGIAAADISVRTLIDVCVLYEGRRLGLRDRQSLTQETPRLRDLCITKAGETK
jgi:hypothetical protein